ncbi:hypothetical protein EV421DRAFT_1738836 [Armillaria borealis]|uniref:Uncharacterized protein n=1 Tax=Armillaria borealis TaxID=47425 RepID=A0AA39J827_9AGAR|nr:hypothetical protein EV421DRAFT_1738836 [Armillaria borealis]
MKSRRDWKRDTPGREIKWRNTDSRKPYEAQASHGVRTENASESEKQRKRGFIRSASPIRPINFILNLNAIGRNVTDSASRPRPSQNLRRPLLKRTGKAPMWIELLVLACLPVVAFGDTASDFTSKWKLQRPAELVVVRSCGIRIQQDGAWPSIGFDPQHKRAFTVQGDSDSTVEVISHERIDDKLPYLDASIPVVSSDRPQRYTESYLLLESERVVFESRITTVVQMIPVPCKLDAPLRAPGENRSGPNYRDLDGSQSLATNRRRHQSKLVQLCKTLFDADSQAGYQSELEDHEVGRDENAPYLGRQG